MKTWILEVVKALSSAPSAIVWVIGPEDRALEAFQALEREMPIPWKLEARRVDRSPLETALAQGGDQGQTKRFLHGLGQLDSQAQVEIFRELEAKAKDGSTATGALVLWLPKSALSLAESSCPTLLEKASLSLEVSGAEIPSDENLSQRQRYAAQLILTLGFQPLHALGSDRFLRPLEDFYVEPQARLGSDEARPLQGILRTSARVVLTGRSGLGKTAGMVAYALALAQEVDNDPLQGRLPLLTHARALEAMLDNSETLSLERVAREANVAPVESPGIVERWAREGTLCLLVDGLDAIAYPPTASLPAWLTRLSETYPQMPLIVAGVSAEEVLPQHLTTASLLPFDFEHIHDYATRYFRLLQAREMDGSVAALESALERESWLLPLAAVPGNLLALCLMILRQGDIPPGRARVLETLLETRLSAWEQSQERGSPDRRAQFNALLSAAAAACLERGTRQVSETLLESLIAGGIDEPEIPGMASSPQAFTARTALEAGVRAGILGRLETGGWGFLEDGIQHYLAAEPLVADRRYGVGRLLAHLDDPEWQDLAVIACGLSVRRASWRLSEFLRAAYPEPAVWDALSLETRARRVTTLLTILLETREEGRKLPALRAEAERLLTALELSEDSRRALQDMLQRTSEL